MLAHAWAGFNATLFAYGQTGSGKTHTMMGSAADAASPPLTQLTTVHLRQHCNKKPSDALVPRRIALDIAAHACRL